MKKLLLVSCFSVLLSLKLFGDSAPVTSAPATSAPKNINVVNELFNFVYNSKTGECLPTENWLKEIFVDQYIKNYLKFNVNKQGKFGMLSGFTWIHNNGEYEEFIDTITFTTIASCVEFKLQLVQKMGVTK